MDPIPFVKVTFEDAQASFHKRATQSERKPHSGKDWTALRSLRPDDVLELGPHAFHWLAILPAATRPRALARHYPRIVNRVAEIWAQPLQCERYLDELMLDKRGGRKGFPLDVASEIVALKLHFLSTTDALQFDVWGGRIRRDENC
jgi:hypothetical protein